MYKKHKMQLLLATLSPIPLLYIFGFKNLDLSLELMLFNLALLIIYSLFLTNLSQDRKLCEKLKAEKDMEIKEKNELWVILNYFKTGIRICVLSISLSLFFKLLNQMEFSYLIQIFNISLLCANMFVFKCLNVFVRIRQVYY